jgi:hypothetical protein
MTNAESVVDKGDNGGTCLVGRVDKNKTQRNREKGTSVDSMLLTPIIYSKATHSQCSARRDLAYRETHKKR